MLKLSWEKLWFRIVWYWLFCFWWLCVCMYYNFCTSASSQELGYLRDDSILFNYYNFYYRKIQTCIEVRRMVYHEPSCSHHPAAIINLEPVGFHVPPNANTPDFQLPSLDYFEANARHYVILFIIISYVSLKNKVSLFIKNNKHKPSVFMPLFCFIFYVINFKSTGAWLFCLWF